MSEDRERDHRLPRGRHELSAEEVAENQRWRLIAATAMLVEARGVGEVTGRAIAREAGVSSTTLYRHFGGLEGLLLATFEAAAGALRRAIAAADLDGDGDEARARRFVAACEWAAAEPQLAAMLGIGPAVASGEIAAAREELIERLIEPLAPRRRGRDGDEAALRRLIVAATLATLADRAAPLSVADAGRLGGELATLLS